MVEALPIRIAASSQEGPEGGELEKPESMAEEASPPSCFIRFSHRPLRSDQSCRPLLVPAFMRSGVIQCGFDVAPPYVCCGLRCAEQPCSKARALEEGTSKR